MKKLEINNRIMPKGRVVDIFFVLSSVCFFVILFSRTFDFENKVTFFIEMFFLLLVIIFGTIKIIVDSKNKNKNNNYENSEKHSSIEN